MQPLKPKITAGLAAACLAACVPAGNDPLEASCDLSAEAFIGQEFDAVQDQIPTEGQTLRVIRPGDIVSLDYRGGRTNIVLDAAGRIEAVECY